MRTIIDKIADSVTAATGLQFYYDSPATLNVRLDNINLPCALMHIVESGAITDENGVMRERLTMQVLFADISSLDYDGRENERVRLDAMKRAALRWIGSLHRSGELRLVSIGDTARYYATDDAIITAYAVTVTIDELEGVCYGGFEAGNSQSPCLCQG